MEFASDWFLGALAFLLGWWVTVEFVTWVWGLLGRVWPEAREIADPLELENFAGLTYLILFTFVLVYILVRRAKRKHKQEERQRLKEERLQAKRERLRKIEEKEKQKREEIERGKRERLRKIKEEERAEKRRKKEYWRTMGGSQFEKECAELMSQLGYEVILTPLVGDEGVDIVARRDGRKIAVQCKAWVNSRVGRPDVQRLAGVVAHEDYDRGMIIALSGVTSEAERFAKKAKIACWNVNDLVRLAEGG